MRAFHRLGGDGLAGPGKMASSEQAEQPSQVSGAGALHARRGQGAAGDGRGGVGRAELVAAGERARGGRRSSAPPRSG